MWRTAPALSMCPRPSHPHLTSTLAPAIMRSVSMAGCMPLSSPLASLFPHASARHYASKPGRWGPLHIESFDNPLETLRKRIYPVIPPKPREHRTYLPPSEVDEVDPYEINQMDFVGERRAVAGLSNLKPVVVIPPILRLPKHSPDGASHGTGGRKTARAAARLRPGTGLITVNSVPVAEYFPSLLMRDKLIQPFIVTETMGKFDCHFTLHGGGKQGQAVAARLAASRALQNYNPTYRPVLKTAMMLVRDARAVERKKAGRLKARKLSQWSKR
eukprot:TRINITY_DN5583_c0_g1_i1.p1 TRINITY_DN5583_c0_g1~~TRINITY_DN5583_c0_g1_i1.p1  ORF type:complete len:273 (-),score=31.56 TRINITY_DN5583_c0_g1_i1:261-1079(-)